MATPHLSGRWANRQRARSYGFTPEAAVPAPVRLVVSDVQPTPAEGEDAEQAESAYARALRLLDALLTLSTDLHRENAILRLSHDRLAEQLAAVAVALHELRTAPPPAAIDTALVDEQAQVIGALRAALTQAQDAANTRPTHLVNLPPEGAALRDIVADAITQALERTSGVQSHAAALLRLSPRVMNYRVKMIDQIRRVRCR